MNRTRLFIGVLLAGVIAPALGISGNASESNGRIIAAMCFTLGGTLLIVREAWISKRADERPRD